MELLSFKGLCHIVGVPQSTAGNWMEEFTIYIPKTLEHDGMYYLPEAIDMLRFIKKCKLKNYENTKIMKMLADRSFPIRVENTIEGVQMNFDQEDYRDNILAVMQTIGVTVSNVETQEKALQAVKAQQAIQKRRIKIIEKQMEEIDQLKLEIKALKQQSTKADEYEMKKYSLAKLFE